jgi:hypothetical protein
MRNFIFTAILALSVMTTMAELTTVEEEDLQNSLDRYEAFLQGSFENLETAVESISTAPINCKFNRACETNYGFGSFDLTYTPDSQFSGIETNRNEQIFKQLPGSNVTDNLKREICTITGQVDSWNANLGTEADALKWQYWGGRSGLFGIYPAFDWSAVEECPSDYDPTDRPWYQTGATGQKNIVFVIDVSSGQPDSGSRLAIQKAIVRSLLDSLGYRDFFNIITYHRSPTMFSSTLVQATDDNLATAYTFLSTVTIRSSSQANMGLTMRDTLNMLQTSATDGDTSGCHNVMFWLSGGSNDLTEINPSTILSQSSLSITLFSYVVAPGNENPPHLTPKDIACQGNGIFAVITSSDEVREPLIDFTEYFSSAIENTEVRWSPPYNDALIPGLRLITGARPVYITGADGIERVKGVLGIDVDLNVITHNGTYAEDDVVDYLVKNQVCEELDLDPSVRDEVQGANTCNANNGGVSEGYAEKNKGWIAAVSTIFALITIAFGAFCTGITKKDKPSKWIGVVIMIVCWIAVLLIFFLPIYDDIIQVTSWKETELVTEALDENPFKCCDVINCRCENYYGPDQCGILRKQLLTDDRMSGTCGKGPKCCRHRSYQCNCRLKCKQSCKNGRCTTKCKTKCDTCRECIQSVHNERCDVQCGTCYTPTVTAQFYNEDTDSVVTTYRVDTCGRDNRQCAINFLNSYGPIGSKRIVYYDPANPTSIDEDIGYRGWAIGLCAFFGVVLLIGMCLACCNCSNRRRNSNASSAKAIEMPSHQPTWT